MEAELLAGVIQTDTHKRLQVSEQLIHYFKKEENFDDFPEFDRLISGLSSWMGSSNFKVSESTSGCTFYWRGMMSLFVHSDFCKWHADYGGFCYRDEGKVSSTCTNK